MKNFKTKMSFGITITVLFLIADIYIVIINNDYSKQDFFVPFVACTGFAIGFIIWIWQLVMHNKKTKEISKKLKEKKK